MDAECIVEVPAGELEREEGSDGGVLGDECGDVLEDLEGESGERGHRRLGNPPQGPPRRVL